MNCLNNYIGYKGCTDGTPGSGLFVNSLPGLPSELLTKIANSDQVTAANVWRDVEITSQSQLLLDTSTAFGDRYKIRSIASVIDIGKEINTVQVAPAPLFQGFEIDPQNTLSNGYVRSNLMGIAVDSVSFYLRVANLTQNFELRVYDADLNSLVYSQVVDYTTLVVGWNEIPINRIFELKRLAFTLDYTELTSFDLELNDELSDYFSDCLCECLRCDGCMGAIRGVSKNGATYTYGTTTFGLTASISLVCSYEGLICTNKKSFARSYWYLTGHHLLQHALYTPSFSRYNTIDKEKTKELMDYFFQMYEKELEKTVKGINLDMQDVCLNCDALIRNEWAAV